jgi:hypothetical protein
MLEIRLHFMQIDPEMMAFKYLKTLLRFSYSRDYCYSTHDRSE